MYLAGVQSPCRKVPREGLSNGRKQMLAATTEQWTGVVKSWLAGDCQAQEEFWRLETPKPQCT